MAFVQHPILYTRINYDKEMGKCKVNLKKTKICGNKLLFYKNIQFLLRILFIYLFILKQYLCV